MTELSPERAADLAAAPLARAYLAGDADPVAVTEVFLERIAAAEGSAVYLAVTADRARREAAAAKARYAAGTPASPIDGVPVAWKDLFDIKGVVTTGGSAVFRHAAPAEADAPAVARLTAAGAVALGKVNLTEFAYSGLGLNPHYGTPVNPHDPETPRAPGGSSSGSAVAVATGLATVAIGSDTGGSIRVPAAFNGIVGLKVSEGRVPTEGVIPLSPSLDTVGPLARTVEDCVLVDAALRGAMPTARRGDVKGMELVVCESVMLDGCEDAVVAAFDGALTRLERAGAKITRRTIPEVEEVARLTAECGTIVSVEAYDYHRERIEGPEVEEMDGRVVARILRGKAMTGLEHLTLTRARAALPGAIAKRLDGAFMVCPSVAHVAPEIAPLDADWELFNAVNMKTLRNTSIGNFLNMPGVSLPAATTSPMPVGFLLAGPGGSDEQVMSAALAVERILRGD
ncbi:amidase [Acuticoccus mangrovi]|uniref:Indoleacetamide hydrolase n=1 Tax=Acuticoccus mangrovi TaxID=2796142 RepID=A0A934MFQ2_9HYPH|nr:amidase [Acuticoccus mangrovi]